MDKGRVCFCSYSFANLLKRDSAFMRYGDATQNMLIKGVIGEVDGCKIVKVPASRLPLGCAFILTHPVAACAPKILEDYKIHDNPPGISGWLVEGRFIFDCFVLNEKRNAVYYHGSQAALTTLDVRTAATDTGKSTIMYNGTFGSDQEVWYKTGATATAVTYDVVLSSVSSTDVPGTTLYNWNEMKSGSDFTNFLEITPASGDKLVQVVLTTSSDHKAKAIGQAILNIG